MAPVGLKEPEDPYVSNGNTNSTRNSGAKTNTNQSQNNPDDNLIDGEDSNYSPRNYGNSYGDSSTGTVDESKSMVNSGGSDSKSNKNSNQSLTGSSVSNSSADSGETDSPNAGESTSSSSTVDPTAGGSTSTSSGCTYPSGSVSIWWKRATQAQKNCYVTKNGQPDFSNPEPYFCDYENNEDCYIR